MDKSLIKGVVVPILTPIDENERIDEEKLRSQVDYVIEGGVLGILAFGSNGEFYMVEEDEMERGLEIMISQSNGRVPVYFGIGAISTKKCVRLAKMAIKKGAYGISVLQPMFLKPTEEELFLHFKTIADAVPSTPMLLYNNPGRVGYTMSANLVDRLAHEVENIVGMKDTSGDITQMEEVIRRTRDVDFKVLVVRILSFMPLSAMELWEEYALQPTSCHTLLQMYTINSLLEISRDLWRRSSNSIL